jgi:hypothetical protein
MDDKFLINLEILGRKYPLYIPRKDEEIMRRAAKEVERVYDDYVLSYDIEDLGKSGKDIMSMVACFFAMRSLGFEDEADLLPFVKRIEVLNAEVTEFLAEDKPL